MSRAYWGYGAPAVLSPATQPVSQFDEKISQASELLPAMGEYGGLFVQLIRTESEPQHTSLMSNLITHYCLAKGWSVQVDQHGNLYVSKGAPPAESPHFPCIVAHMDTVHDVTGHAIVPVVIGDRVIAVDYETMKQVGTGGDDKCGIFAALYCMDQLDYAKVAFFVDEEIGCDGSAVCDLKFFADCRFVLQADRRGGGDFVTDISGPISSKAFRRDAKAIAAKFGYAPESGALTDVKMLRDRDVGVSLANLSAGYHNPHSPHEYIVISELLNCCGLMLEMCRSMRRQYRFIAPKRKLFGVSKYTSGFDRVFGAKPKAIGSGEAGSLQADRNLLDSRHSDYEQWYFSEAAKECELRDPLFDGMELPEDASSMDAGLDAEARMHLDSLSVREWAERRNAQNSDE